MNKKYKKFAYLTIATIFLLSIINTSYALGASFKTQSTEFDLPADDPQAFGAIIPAPNMFGTYSIQGTNQGRFDIIDWQGNSLDEIIVNTPGEDISLEAYPQYFDYITKTPTPNDYIDPWDTNWFNVSAYNSEINETNPYTLSSVFDSYKMGENEELFIQLIDGMPVQINLNIQGAGPKILKLDWSSGDGLPSTNRYKLISPNGVPIDTHYGTPTIFNYLLFIASSTGTYRLLMDPDPTPDNVFVEFVDSEEFDAPIGGITVGGSGDEFPSQLEVIDAIWTTEWFSTSISAGQKLKVDVIEDYNVGNNDFDITLWRPCRFGHEILFTTSTFSDIIDTFDLVSGNSGKFYISISGNNLYRIRFSVENIPSTPHTIGDTQEFQIERNERKAIHFSLNSDAVVAFNFTSKGLGDPFLYSGLDFLNENRFLSISSRKPRCNRIVSWIETIQVATGDIFRYYNMPAGDYHAIIRNDNPAFNGYFKISSRIIEEEGEDVPITILNYPSMHPEETSNVTFFPDSFHSDLKNAKLIDLPIEELGQYRLNLSINADDFLPQIPLSASPSYIFTYNSTSGEYTDYTDEASSSGDSFPAMENPGDQLIIAFSEKWHGLQFSFSQLGVGGGWTNSPYVWTGASWAAITRELDETGEFGSDDGTVAISLTDIDFDTWKRGSDLDLSQVSDESDYYWMNISCNNDYSTIPEIDLINMENVTIIGDLNFHLIGKSGYLNSFSWDLPFSGYNSFADKQNIIINQEASYLNQDWEEWILENDDPKIIGVDEGPYKLLVVPNDWSNMGNVSINLAISDFSNRSAYETYDINASAAKPNLFANQINNYTDTGYGHNNESFFEYVLTKSYNHTLSTMGPFNDDESYFILECTGKPYSWTQLVVAIYNVSDYELYLVQDLNWINSNGPNFEIRTIATTVSVNATYEFGIISEKFYLIFELEEIDDMITFKLDLSQYPTQQFNIQGAARDGPFNWLLIVIIIGAVGAVALLGAGIYFIRKRGGIRSKRPS